MDDDKPTTKRPRYLAPRVKVSLSQAEADRFKAVAGLNGGDRFYLVSKKHMVFLEVAASVLGDE